MRTVLISISIIFILSSCNTATTVKNNNNDYSENLNNLSPFEERALEDVLHFTSEMKTRSGDNSSRSILSDLDQYQWTSYSYYRLDGEKFMQNPMPTNFRNCLSVPVDWILLAGKKESGEYISMEITEVDENWRPKTIRPVSVQQQSWINDVSAKADPGAFIIIDIYSRLYYAFSIDEDLVFYSPTGIVQTFESVCSFMELKYENIKEAAGDYSKLLVL